MLPSNSETHSLNTPVKNATGTAFITGGSRGIGKAIALKLAQQGYNIIIGSKTAEAHPKLEGTIYTAAEEIEKAGGKCLPLQLDVRDEVAIKEAVAKGAAHFGGIDVLVNNASAISLTPTLQTEPKRFDLMMDIEIRGTFFMCQACIPYLQKSTKAHILNLSPPLNLDPRWFAPHVAYTIAKYGMSMIVMGLSAELKKDGIAVNALWPKTTIATAAVQNILGGDTLMRLSRKPEIVADAAYAIISKPPAACTGNFFIDEDVLVKEGITDFEPYAVTPGGQLMNDLFV